MSLRVVSFLYGGCWVSSTDSDVPCTVMYFNYKGLAEVTFLAGALTSCCTCSVVVTFWTLLASFIIS